MMNKLVTFIVAAIALFGTYTIQADPSGDWHETFMDHKSFSVLADYLTRNGIAVIVGVKLM